MPQLCLSRCNCQERDQAFIGIFSKEAKWRGFGQAMISPEIVAFHVLNLMTVPEKAALGDQV